LGVSSKTLRRWILLLNQENPRQPIETPRHHRNGHFRVIAEEDLQRIIAARAEMPGAISSASKLAFDRRQSENGAHSDAAPTVTPAPRPRPRRQAPLSAVAEGLPDGWMDVTMASRLHNVPRATLAAWVRDGRVETDRGTYGGEHGHWPIVRPLTRRGLAQLVTLARGRDGFTPCPDCPHDAHEA
jgi:hypothetical protein